jgi:hypothetical protein
VTVFLFNAAEGRFSARAWGRIRLEAPLDSLWRGSALYAAGLAVARDFNGDGRDDFACVSGPGWYSVWLSTERGFGSEPDQRVGLAEDVESVAFQERLGRGQVVVIGLRGARRLCVLRSLPGAVLDGVGAQGGAHERAETNPGESIRYLHELVEAP